MGREANTHVGFDELHPLEQRIAALEQVLRFVNDKVDFVMQIATATLAPKGSEFALDAPKPVQVPLAELYRMVRVEGRSIERHSPEQSTLVMP